MAPKKSLVFFCRECGFESAKWMGQCPACHEWNTFTEEPSEKKKSVSKHRSQTFTGGSDRAVSMSDISTDTDERMASGFAEFDRVLGGGIVRGSMVLVGGDPGIGKSTLLLQVCRNLADTGVKVLYVSGEESLRQIKLRADRIGEFKPDMKLLCETDLDLIEEAVNNEKPAVLVIDSIQTMYAKESDSACGSISQVREATSRLMQIAKTGGVSVFVIGHVTREGTVAGPRTLEHMVDTVLYFEGDRYASYRILRGVKNRFGSTNEIGVFEMGGDGLREVANPSEYMLNGKPAGASGSVVACSVEGTRPILVEIQALVTHTAFGIPRRTAAGCDVNRVNLLMAVLEKRVGIPLADCDAYINVAGGMKVNEPAMDLAVVIAVISSKKDKVVPDDVICFGEVGLSGEVRAVSQPKARVSEAKKLGFKTVIMPLVCVDAVKDIDGIELVGVANVRQAQDYIDRMRDDRR